MANRVNGEDHGVPQDIALQLHEQPRDAVFRGLHNQCTIRAVPEDASNPFLHSEYCAKHHLLTCSQDAHHRAVLQSLQTQQSVAASAHRDRPPVHQLLLISIPISGTVGGQSEVRGFLQGHSFVGPPGCGDGMISRADRGQWYAGATVPPTSVAVIGSGPKSLNGPHLLAMR